MAKKRVFERVSDTSPTFRRLDSADIEDALGATAVARKAVSGNPLSLTALRSKLLAELVSSGGRPSRREVVSRKKIPLTESEWKSLDDISRLLKRRGVNASSGQVAGVLLHHSISEVIGQLDDPTFTKAAHVSQVSDDELENTLEGILDAAASAEVHLEQLRPIALELLRRMRAGRGAEANDHPPKYKD